MQRSCMRLPAHQQVFARGSLLVRGRELLAALNSVATKKVVSSNVRQMIAGSACRRSSFLIGRHVLSLIHIGHDLRSLRDAVSASRRHHKVLLDQTELVRLALRTVLSQVRGA